MKCSWNLSIIRWSPGRHKRVGLFWFTISPVFTGELADEKPEVEAYLTWPEIVLEPIWRLADRTELSLSDAENSPTAPSSN